MEVNMEWWIIMVLKLMEVEGKCPPLGCHPRVTEYHLNILITDQRLITDQGIKRRKNKSDLFLHGIFFQANYWCVLLFLSGFKGLSVFRYICLQVFLISWPQASAAEQEYEFNFGIWIHWSIFLLCKSSDWPGNDGKTYGSRSWIPLNVVLL